MSTTLDGRVIVTRAVCGVCHMQVCAVPDATDEEILAVCNTENPSGTTHGWVKVLRGGSYAPPVHCDTERSRLHFMVEC